MRTALAALLILVVFAWEAAAIGDFRIDDAYITFSFARNLAEGHGPVYAHGARVEGYSNFLWMALLAQPLSWPELDPYAAARLLAAPFLVVLALAMASLTRRAWAGGALLLLAAHADLAAAALSGLETVPYTALLALAFAVYLRAPTHPLVVPSFVLVALMRIDGFIPLGYVLAFEAARRARAGAPLRPLLAWALPGLALYAAWFAWRWSYYGLAWPLPYHAKALVAQALPGRGAEHAWETLRVSGGWFAAPFVLVGAVRGGLAGAALGGFVVVHAAYVISVGGDWMPFGRFFLPIAPLWAALFVEGLARAARPRWLAAAGAVAYALVLVHLDARATPAARHRREAQRAWTARVEESLRPAARLLRHVIRPGETLLTDYAGVFAVETDAAVLDLFGLCNPAVALRGGTVGVDPVFGRFCPECYAEQQPDYLVVMPPMIRAADAFTDQEQVIEALFKGPRLAEPLGLRTRYVAGRVLEGGRGVWFLERRRPGARLARREPAPGITLDYPFEP